MAARIPAGLTPASAQADAVRKGRRFAFVVGGAFLVLASFAYWRGRQTPAIALGLLGGTLVLAGLAIPGQLGPVERAWMAFGHALSKVTTPVFMGVIYFLVLTPAGVVRRMLGKNALARPSASGSYWVSRGVGARRSDLERQF